jgi:hypothetical protein
MASGNSLVGFTPQANEAPVSNGATLDMRNAIMVLDFDATTEKTAVFRGILPRHYASGGITASIHWMATSATSGDVKWGLAFERDNANNHDLDADAFATEQTGTGTANATSGKTTTTTITFTDGAILDSLAVGDPFRLKLARKAADGADTMTGDAEFIGLELRET